MTAIILVHPQLGENIGMVARAMLNFGLTDLRLVAPREGWPNEKAYATASGANTVLDSVQFFDTTREAIADLTHIYATTARKRDQVKHVYTSRQASAEIKSLGEETRTGILFGAERTGLSNEDTALATALITYPTNPKFTSLNLAQAVLLMAYELFQTNESEKEARLYKGQTPFAKADQIENFLTRLYEDLETRHFFKTEENKPHMKKNIDALFARARLTEQELNTLHGIISALKKPD